MYSRIISTITAFVLAIASSVTLSAQNRTVSGKVQDAGGLPVIGMAVLVTGTSNGVITDENGDFSITVPSSEVKLTFTAMGYLDKEVVVPASKSVINVVVEEDAMLLDETIVVGYGTQKKVNLTGSVAAIEAKSLENRTAHNLSTMLQGAVAGLNVSTSSGNPGSTGKLNIRGVASISKSLTDQAEPLVLIDGAPGDLNRVNQNDVESISVIKDASAAAVYGARGTFGVILITTKSGADKSGKATVKYSGRFGWEEPTTSTDYETRGYWSAYTVDKFWSSDAGKNYTAYNDYDMAQLLARVNDKTENPDRPWIVEDFRNGRRQWVYYCNTDWYHELYNDQHPTTQHQLSISGGNKDVRYYISGSYDRQVGVVKVNPDVFQKYNLRAKLDFNINKHLKMTNNTSFYQSTYDWVGAGDVQDSFAYAARHALASFPLKNPDGSWVYGTPMIAGGNYNVANGRHIIFGDGIDKNNQTRTDFSNMTQFVYQPIKQLTFTANATYRLYQNRDMGRTYPMSWRRYPDAELESYTTGAGTNELTETTATYNRISSNVFGTYEDTFNEAHHLTLTAGMNLETYHRKTVSASGQNLLSTELNDLNLVGPDETGAIVSSVSGGKTAFSLLGFFGRVNYDFKGRYLFEASARYDGTSRFAPGQRWGFFPSASAGWRISEEPFFASVKPVVNNLKLRASFGSLGNQEVSDYAYLQKISFYEFNTSGHYSYAFGEGSTNSKYASLSAPVSSSLTWETANQYDLGLDLGMFKNRLQITSDVYVRNTVNMLVDGIKLPGVYGADSPQTNSADLSTRGYEIAVSWKDEFNLAGHPFGYGISGTLSDYATYVTRYDNNPNNLINDYYVGQRIGDIWGFVVDGLFESDEEAKKYNAEVCDIESYITGRMTGGVLAGDLRSVDLPTTPVYQKDADGNYVLDENGQKIVIGHECDGKLSLGAGTLDDPGDRKILGNSLASLQYGLTFSFDWLGFDVSAFFQGTGNHYWYPAGMNYAFWGPYSYSYVSFIPRDFYTKMCWSEEHPDAYFPRPRAYSSTGGELSKVNSRYLQNLRYLRFKNLTVGYTIPESLTKKIRVDHIRVYFSGENLCYWSPLKKVTKYLDPESAYTRYSTSANARDHYAYPWQKTYMFGIDITF